MEMKMEHCWENLWIGKWGVAGRIYGEENGALPGEFIPQSVVERTVEMDSLDDFPSKDEKVPSSVRRTLEPFQRQRWGTF